MAVVDEVMDLDDIRDRMKALGYKQVDLVALLDSTPGKVSLSLSGRRRFTVAEMDKIRAWLGESAVITGEPVRSIPIIGQVAAGSWQEAVQKASHTIPAPADTVPKRAFGLRVQGDSMDLVVPDGGTVIVDPDDKALFPKSYYVILNEDGDATFKQFLADPARLAPCSSNPAYKEIMMGSGEQFTVVGRVIWQASPL
jgi:repressor LexA